jgi:hypothetical protein
MEIDVVSLTLVVKFNDVVVLPWVKGLSASVKGKGSVVFA